MNEPNTHIYCPTCRWIGTWDQCEDRPTGKYKGETNKWCPKCGRCKTFRACPAPLQFPIRYPDDVCSLPALSIRQPWAWLVAGGVKTYENRVWAASNPGRKFRGRFLIHAAQGCTRDEYDSAAFSARAAFRRGHAGAEIEIPPLMIMPRGCIIGAATVTGWCDEAPDGNPWAFTSGLIIESAEMFAPIMCKGALGFFKPVLESEVKS